jgi:hypothetical protein
MPKYKLSGPQKAVIGCAVAVLLVSVACIVYLIFAIR